MLKKIIIIAIFISAFSVFCEGDTDIIVKDKLLNSQIMINKIKDIIEPYIYNWGFLGSYPNYSRSEQDQLETINFQMHRDLTSVCVNLSISGLNHEYVLSTNRETQYRLGAQNKTRIKDHWFIFNPSSSNLLDEKTKLETFGTIYRDNTDIDRFTKIANDIILMLEKYALNWFEDGRGKWIENKHKGAKEYFKLAEKAFDMEKYEEAVSLYTKAIEISPMSTTYYLKRGLAYQYNNDYNNSDKDFNIVLELSPQYELSISSYRKMR